MGKLGLVTLSKGCAFTGNVGSENTDIRVQGPEIGIAQGISSLIGHTKRKNHLADVAFMNERLQLGAIAELHRQVNI